MANSGPFQVLFLNPITSLIRNRKLRFGCIENERRGYVKQISLVLRFRERELR